MLQNENADKMIRRNANTQACPRLPLQRNARMILGCNTTSSVVVETSTHTSSTTRHSRLCICVCVCPTPTDRCIRTWCELLRKAFGHAVSIYRRQYFFFDDYFLFFSKK